MSNEAPELEIARAARLCLEARAIRQIARATRAVIHAQRRRPLRRVLALARGASDEAIETWERRCPYCRQEAVAPTGNVSAANGKIHVEYRCEGCAKPFVFVRSARV